MHFLHYYLLLSASLNNEYVCVYTHVHVGMHIHVYMHIETYYFLVLTYRCLYRQIYTHICKYSCLEYRSDSTMCDIRKQQRHIYKVFEDCLAHRRYLTHISCY